MISSSIRYNTIFGLLKLRILRAPKCKRKCTGGQNTLGKLRELAYKNQGIFGLCGGSGKIKVFRFLSFSQIQYFIIT